MHTQLWTIKAKLETLKIITKSDTTLFGTSCEKYLTALIDVTEEIYLLLNDTLFYSRQHSHILTDKRDKLNHHLNRLDDIQEGNVSSFDLRKVLTELSQDLDYTLEGIDSLLQEISLQSA